MTTKGWEVVIVGGGIVGIATAYYLGKMGVKSLLVEKDSVGSHASGFAYGGLNPLGGEGALGPLFPVAKQGMRLHQELSQILPEDTGVNIEYRTRSSLALAFTDEEVNQAKSALSWPGQYEGYSVRWIDAPEARLMEPRISKEALGAVLMDGTAEVEPYKFSLALVQAAEKLGCTIRHGTVTGLKREGERITGIVLGDEEVACGQVVLSMGPWSGKTSDWLGIPIEVRPLKGQILRLGIPGAPVDCSITWAGNYATTKPDGLLWTGTTEEEEGFNEIPTTEARDSITAALLKMMPSLSNAELIQQTACLRPLSSDGLLLLGAIPGWEGVYMASGAGRRGILLGTAMGHITSDLVTHNVPEASIDAFAPGRFATSD